MKKKVVATLLILTLSFLFTNVNSFATNYSEQKKSAQQEKSKSEQNLKNISQEKKSVQAEVSELNDSIYQVQGELSDLEDQIDELNESIKSKEEELDGKQKLLDERLSAVYMNGDNTYLEALFTGGIINFISNYDMIKQIAEYDNNLIEEVKQTKADLENSKVELEESKKEVEEKQEDLKNQKSEREEKVKSLTAEEQAEQSKIEEKEKEIAKIDSAVKEEQKRLEQERKKSTTTTTSKTNTTKSNSSGSSSSSSSGSTSAPTPASSSASMMWPTRIAKKVNSIYAPNGRDDTVGYYGTKHKGVDINAPSGTPIYAAQEGNVVYVNYSGYGGGWGLYVVIYHGKDSNGNAVYTRYAHASSIASGIQVGTHVTTNTVIMYAGSSGAAEGAHLHFEVCLNGMYNQVNPCPYLGIPNSRGTF